MLYMSSNSGSDGSYSLTVTFEQGTDIDQAAIDVQNRLNQAEPTLPAAVKQQGITVNKESTNIVLFCALEGDSTGKYDALYLTNYANINLVSFPVGSRKWRFGGVFRCNISAGKESSYCRNKGSARRCAGTLLAQIPFLS